MGAGPARPKGACGACDRWCTGWDAGGEPGSSQASAVQVHGGLCVSAVFHFNQAGQVTRLTTADRPRYAAC